MNTNASRRRATARDMNMFATPSLWPAHPFLPLMKAAVAYKRNDKAWLRVRAPLDEAPLEWGQVMIEGLKKAQLID